MRVADGGTLDPAKCIQPKAEAEIAFVLGAGPAVAGYDGRSSGCRRRHAFTPRSRSSDSRIADWKITFADTVADNGSSAVLRAGRQDLPLAGLDLEGAAMEMTCSTGRSVSTGVGAAALGNPLNAAAWLAQTLAARGEPLRAGDVVLAGALGPMAALRPGVRVETRIAGISAPCTFTYGEASRWPWPR
jgi:2-keto-4-pentenoate hydratase